MGSLVGKPRRTCDIADGIDSGLARLAPLVDFNVGAINLNLGAFQSQILNISDNANGENNPIDRSFG